MDAYNSSKKRFETVDQGPKRCHSSCEPNDQLPPLNKYSSIESMKKLNTDVSLADTLGLETPMVHRLVMPLAPMLPNSRRMNAVRSPKTQKSSVVTPVIHPISLPGTSWQLNKK